MFRLLTQGWHCGNDAVRGQAARSSDHRIPQLCIAACPPAKFGNQQAQACRRLALCSAVLLQRKAASGESSLVPEARRIALSNT